jgi:hypothetical protein
MVAGLHITFCYFEPFIVVYFEAWYFFFFFFFLERSLNSKSREDIKVLSDYENRVNFTYVFAGP